jgi:hypothetical protein
MKLYPFYSKELTDIQKKLFRRHVGIQQQLVANGDTTIVYEIPYAWCKITTMEIVGLPEMMKADLCILDSTAGTYTTVPNFQLNQFGFDVNVNKDYYRDHSEYDADLYMYMQIKIVIKNHTANTPTIGINFTLHEVV